VTPGIEAIGVSSASSWKSNGRMKSAGVRIVSRTIKRMAGVRRLRRGRIMGRAWTSELELQTSKFEGKKKDAEN
jgi:hypothetical protein